MRPTRTAFRPASAAASLLGLALAGAVSVPHPAAACGCFAPPDPAVPVVQAGERILFADDNGKVTAHIQIQYAGKPGEFGWLLPLPSIPTDKSGMPGIDLGVDELFSQLTTTTQPKYVLQRVYEQCGSATRGSGNATAAFDSAGGGPNPAPMNAGTPLVVQNSVGPYDYAILKADSKDAMFTWLTTNRYFVPAGTDGAVGPYIRPGAYFLALRLRSGLSAGDLQPVVLHYQSDLPMIPIILTAVAANPNMGIQVWMLGAGRAIPRNYYHTVVNDAQINWFTAGQNYNDVIINAVGEAEGKHAFVTEYAGTSAPMRNLLDRSGRFANLAKLNSATDPVVYMQSALGMFSLNGQFTTLVSRVLPLPAALGASGVTLAQYYQQLSFFLGTDRAANPMKYSDVAAALAAFDPVALTSELQTKIVNPTLDAGALFTSFPYLTRLYTTLSPADMNKDPVFSYNPSLPDYSNVHNATLTYHCSGFFSSSKYSDATLQTASAFVQQYSVSDADNSVFTPLAAPFSQQIQILHDTGAPELVVDNTSAIRGALGQTGCSFTGAAGRSPSAATALGLLLGAAAITAARRRRRAA